MMKQNRDWRDDPSIVIREMYKPCFAWFPVKLEDGTRIFWKTYYQGKRYLFYRTKLFRIETDVIGNITEAEYIIRKLSGGVYTENTIDDFEDD